MRLVDSSGWIEFATDGPNQEIFAEALRDLDQLIVPSLALFEVYRHLLRHAGRDVALAVAATMRQGQVVDLTPDLAVEAAELASGTGLPMADSILYATARANGAELWTQDADFEGLDGVRYVPYRSR